MPQPLILTLLMDAPSQSFYEDLRRTYFPPARNLIPAHLTLFHHLPNEDSTLQAVRNHAQASSSFTLDSPQLRSIGRGVAVFFTSHPLNALHAALASNFDTCLIPQDRQRFQPHIVIQNKVDAATARNTLAALQSTGFLHPHAIGLTLWRYMDGPWQHLIDLPFATHP